MRRFLCVILVLSLMASAFVFSAQAAGAVNFSARVVSDTSGNVHIVFSLNQGSGLGTFKLSVAYDPNVLQISENTSEAYASNLTGTEASDMLWAVNSSKYNQNISGNTASESKVIVGGLYNGTSGLTAGGDIFTLKFKVKSGAPDGNSIIRVIKGEMAYADGTRCDGAASIPDTITIVVSGGKVTSHSASQTESTVILPFDSTTGFNTYFATTKAIESNEKKQGTGSMRMGFNSPTGQNDNVGGMLTYDFTSAQDLSKYSSFSMNIYTPLAMEGKGGRFQVNFITTSGSHDGYNFDCDISNISTGWNTISFNKSSPTATVSGVNWSSIVRIRLTWFNDNQISRQFFLLDNLVGYYSTGSTFVPSVSSIPSTPSTPSTVDPDDTPSSITSDPDASNAFDQWIDSNFVNVSAHSHTFVENNYANTNGLQATLAQEFIPARPYISGASIRLLLVSGYGYARFSIRTDVNDASTEVYGNNYYVGGDNTEKWVVADFTSDSDGNNKTVKVTPGQKYYLVYYYVILDGGTALQYLDNVGTSQANSAWVKVYPNSTFTRNPTYIAPFDIKYDTAVENAAKRINVIGNVTINSGANIAAARAAYDSLTNAQKKALTSEYATLQAAENTYNSIDKPYGDLNNDGIVHASDALIALKAVVGKVSLTSYKQTLANVDGSAGVSATDASMILQYSIGAIANFTSVSTTASAAYASGYNPGTNSSYKVTATVGSTSSIKSGQSFTLPVTMSSTSNGYAYITVSKPTFDTSMLEFTGFQAASGFSNAYKSNTSSLYAVMPSVTNASTASSNSSGVVVYLGFKAKKDINTTTAVSTGVYASVYTDTNYVNNSGAAVTVNAGSITPPAVPTFTLNSTNKVAATQTASLSITTSVGVKGYYFGTSNSYLGNTFISTTSKNPSLVISNAGTYYFTILDDFDNVSETKTLTYYQTILNSNGGSDSNTTVLTQSGKSFELPIYTREGYSFNGWSTDPNATSGGINQLTPTSNTTYYAVWKDVTNPTVSVVSTNEIASSQTLTFTLSDNDAIAGYYYGTNSNYSQNLYTISSETTVSKVVSKAGTYYFNAVDAYGGISNTVAVTFHEIILNANGGLLNTSLILAQDGVTINLPETTKPSCEFLGWTANGNTYVSSITPYSSVVYRAMWKNIIKPTISLDITNNLSSKQKVTINMTSSVGIAGYYFGTADNYLDVLYYNVLSNSVVVTINDAGAYYFAAEDIDGNISNVICVTFYETVLNKNDGTDSTETVLAKAGNSFVLPIPQREGYTFSGWAPNADAVSGVYRIAPSSNATYYAVWTDNITLYATVGKVVEDAGKQVKIPVTMNDYHKPYASIVINGVNYNPSILEFVGFEVPKNEFFNNRATASFDNESLIYQVFNAPKTVEDANATSGGIIAYLVFNVLENTLVESPVSVTFDADQTTVYLNDNWVEICEVEEVSVTAGSIITTPDDIKPEGAIESTNNISDRQNVTITLSDNKAVKGYYFGTSENYLDNNCVEIGAGSIVVEVDAAGTYYLTVIDTAGNISDTVSITFNKITLNANDGTVDPEYLILVQGSEIELPTASKDGNTLVGWSIEQDTNIGVNTIVVNGNLTYYAIWENDAVKAQTIFDMINNIGEVTLESEDAITSTKEAYNALSDSQKTLVTNIDVLKNAEKMLRQLKNIELGDIDDDKDITILDALKVLQAIVGKITLNNLEESAADVDGRTGVSIYDALLILQKAVSKITLFPIEK